MDVAPPGRERHALLAVGTVASQRGVDVGVADVGHHRFVDHADWLRRYDHFDLGLHVIGVRLPAGRRRGHAGGRCSSDSGQVRKKRPSVPGGRSTVKTSVTHHPE